MIHPRLALIVLVTVSFAACLPPMLLSAEPSWQIGLASRDITPGEPVRMAGYGSKERQQPFQSVASRLHAKAMAIQDPSGNRALLITTDVIGLTAAVAAPLYERLTKETGLPRQQILINSSHTHSGPVLKLEIDDDKYSKEDAEATVRYTRWLSDELVEMSTEATQNRSPASLSWGVGFASFVMNRRQHTDRGVRLGFNPRGLADRSVPVLRIDDLEGNLRGVLFGAACHNTTLTHLDMQISGDFAGHARAFIESHFDGVQAMFMQGCGGDANPYPRGSEEIARIHGMTLGGEVQRVLNTELEPVTGRLRTLLSDVRLPLDTELSDAEFSLLEKASGATREVAREIREKNASGEALASDYDSHVALWQFGTGLTLVALPGEVVVDYVPLIEQAIGPRKLWVSAYNHDVFGYVPSARTLQQGGYEMRGIYSGGSGIFAPQIERVIVEKVRELAVQAERPSELMPKPAS